MKTTRAFLESESFVEVTTPTITGLTGACEDFSTLFPLEYFGHRAFLTQTAQLHLEPLIHSQALRRVYAVNHSYRAEPRADNRHLTEFVLIEPEIGEGNLETLIDIEERLVTYVLKSALQNRREDPRVVNAVDLLLPGVGEVSGGAEREEDPNRLRERLMKSSAMQQLLAARGSADDYEWYLQLREMNSIPYAGFGMGFERLVHFIRGSKSCLDCIEYPRNSVHYMP